MEDVSARTADDGTHLTRSVQELPESGNVYVNSGRGALRRKFAPYLGHELFRGHHLFCANQQNSQNDREFLRPYTGATAFVNDTKRAKNFISHYLPP